MNIGDEKVLNKEVKFIGKIYGLKGEKVKIISISGNAVIFERKNGKRFPCNIKDFN